MPYMDGMGIETPWGFTVVVNNHGDHNSIKDRVVGPPFQI